MINISAIASKYCQGTQPSVWQIVLLLLHLKGIIMLIHAIIKCVLYFYWDKDNSETKQAIDFEFLSYSPLIDAYVL